MQRLALLPGKGDILSRERISPLDPQENARGAPLDPRQCGLCFHRPYFCQISQLSGAYSKSCGQLTEKNAVEIEKQRSHPR